MKYSDVKTQHIYSVDFDPVHQCEFNSKHFALVLKKNMDKKTVMVMPLTTSSRGNGCNKVHLGILKTLPSSLQTDSTYAVFNQIRTLNTDRFKPMLDGSNNIMECKIDNDTFKTLMNLAITDITYDMQQDEKITLFKELYDKHCTIKAVNLAYNILRLKQQSNAPQSQIDFIEKNIRDTLHNVPYSLQQKDIDNGIKTLIDEILNRKCS